MTSPSTEEVAVYYLHPADEMVPSGLTGIDLLQITGISPEAVDESPASLPIVTSGETVTSEIADPAGFASRLHSEGGVLIILPPLDSEEAITSLIGTEAEGPLFQDNRSTKITTFRGLREESGQVEFQITSEQSVRASGMTVHARDEDGHPVIVDRRPRSTAGGILLSTAELHQPSLRTREKDREQLLAGLFSLGRTRLTKPAPKEPSDGREDTQAEIEFESSTVDRVLLALATLDRDQRGVSEERINSVLPSHLKVELTADEWEALRDQIAAKGILDNGGEVNTDALRHAIETRDLESFVRRLRNYV